MSCEPAKTNLAFNPSAETNLVGITGSGAQTRVATGATQGAFAVQVVCDGTGDNQGIGYLSELNLNYTGSARTFICSFDISASEAGTIAIVLLRATYNDASFDDSVQINNLAVTTHPTRVSTNTVTINPAKTMTHLELLVIQGAAPSTPITFFTDAVQIEESAAATKYFDGSLGAGYRWTGTAHNTSSTRSAYADCYGGRYFGQQLRPRAQG